MISVLFDSDWMVDYLNGKPAAIQFFSSLADDGVGISIITYAELHEGALGSSRREARLQQLEELVEAVDVIPIDFAVAQRFGEVRRALARAGRPIPDMDSLIAATALRHNIPVASRDGHFRNVAGLTIREPR